VEHPTFYRTVQIDGVRLFYREAGSKEAPTLLLLHGLPSSSRMFEPLLTRLADCCHLIAPDYPGFGHSEWPAPKEFGYTFDRYANIVAHFAEALGLSRYTLYLQDYGGPVGFRIAMAHPERIEGLVVQNAVAHNEGLGKSWEVRRAFWADRVTNESALRANWRRRRLDTSGLIPTQIAMTRTSGRTNSPFSANLPRRKFKATFSTITAQTSTPIRNGRVGCSRSNRRCSWRGGSLIRRSNARRPRPIDAMCRAHEFTFSTLVISHWTPLRMKLPRWFGAL
jgi:pimeloyl-ACP methyl ester carboxylesterase